MTDIDFIKWLVGYADGFEYSKKHFYGKGTPFIEVLKERYVINDDTFFCEEDLVKSEIFHPLLLQRSIEGINRKYLHSSDEGYEIRYSEGEIEYFIPDTGWSNLDISNYNSIDQAKEEALRYVYKKEIEL